MLRRSIESGRGGRAQELALAFALEIAGDSELCALFAGTDGRDGPTTAAGAVVDGRSAARMHTGGVDPRAALENNDSHAALAASGDLLESRTTHTNVNDIALIQLRSRA